MRRFVMQLLPHAARAAEPVRAFPEVASFASVVNRKLSRCRLRSRPREEVVEESEETFDRLDVLVVGED